MNNLSDIENVLYLGVHDIDAEDEENPQLCTEYAPLMYAYLRQLEKDQPIRKDFLKVCKFNTNRFEWHATLKSKAQREQKKEFLEFNGIKFIH